jgi:hypothetical protein
MPYIGWPLHTVHAPHAAGHCFLASEFAEPSHAPMPAKRMQRKGLLPTPSGESSVQHGAALEALAVLVAVPPVRATCRIAFFSGDANAEERPDEGSRHIVSSSLRQVAGSP